MILQSKQAAAFVFEQRFNLGMICFIIYSSTRNAFKTPKGGSELIT